MAKTKIPLTQEYIKSILDYNPETGIFVWKRRENLVPLARGWNKNFSGKQAGRKAPNSNGGNCIRIRLHGIIDYQCSHLAWCYVYGEWPTFEIDHRDRNRFNDKISNLRKCTHIQNCHNRGKHKDNASGYKGVFKDKRRDIWYCQIQVNKKSIWLGHHITKEDAAIAYDSAAIKYFGEFAHLNFPSMH